MNGKRAMVLAVLVAVAGCAPAGWPYGAWVKPDVEPREQRRDEYECTRRATLAAETRPARAAVFAECMKARGYQRAQAR